jgi:hypothetical protein
VNFHHFANIKRPSTSIKYFLFKKLKKIHFNFFIDIILQLVLGLVFKIYKYLKKIIPPYTRSISKTWLHFLKDELEEHHKFGKIII